MRMTDDMGPLPKVHSRIAVIHGAGNDLDDFLGKWQDRFGLSSAEYTLVLSLALQRFASRLVAIERRGTE